MKYLGNLTEDQFVDFFFSTHQADGTPIILDGTPAVSVYRGGSPASSTTVGITLTVNASSVTGFHHVRIDTAADAFYAIANDYAAVITTGTVDGVSVVGTVLAAFSIENRFREVDVIDWKGAAAPAMTGDAYAEIGAAGASLTAVPWNAAWDTEVESECTDALVAYDGTGVAAEASLTTLSDKFAGITVLANWLRGLFRKDVMDATAKGQVNAAGGTYNEATDSLEAQQEHAATIKAETALILADTGTDGVVEAAASKTGYVLSATGADLVLKTSTFALAMADAVCDEALSGHTTAGTVGAKLNAYPYSVTPLGVTVSAGAVSEHKLTAYQNQSLGPFVFTVVDSSSNPVSLAGKTVRFDVAEIGKTGSPDWSYSSTGSQITISGSSNNIVTLSATDTYTGTAGLFAYRLRNHTDEIVLDTGTLKIVPGVASS